MGNYVSDCTKGKEKRKDGKASRGDCSTKGKGNRTEQNDTYNRFIYSVTTEYL